jgi:hypothetical protein
MDQILYAREPDPVYKKKGLRMPRHIMVDIESLDVRPTGIILSIGAVEFDPLIGYMGAEFLRNIDTASCTALGMTTDSDTQEWWARQAPEAWAATQDNQVPIREALTDFADFCRGDDTTNAGEPAPIWCKGPSFDFAMLTNAYRMCAIPLPWQFRQERDLRTAIQLAQDIYGFKKPAHTGVPHSALDDARHQVLVLIGAYQKA